MKNVIVTLSAIAILWFVFFNCKKDLHESFALTSINSFEPHIDKMTAKVNSADWTLATENKKSATIISSIRDNYSFSGRSSFKKGYTLISINFVYSKGSVYLGKRHKSSSILKNLSAHYWDSKGTCFTSRSGIVNISELDTIAHNGSGLTKFSATFSFNTDTIAGVSYKITNGIIDYQNK